MILPKDRDPRFITIRRGGTLMDSDHRLLALWAASCAEHVLHLFESVQPSDPRPREAIEQILPHREPFLLIDEVLELRPGEGAVARKTVRADEWYLSGHFPGHVIGL
jgi:hypothetical protein